MYDFFDSILIALFAIDFALFMTWYPIYYKRGVILYSKSYPLRRSAPIKLGTIALNKAFRNPKKVSYVFKEIGPNEFAFREKIFQAAYLMYSPIMHGNMKLDESNSEIEITGFLNIWPPLGLLFIVVLASEAIQLIGTLFIFLPIVLVTTSVTYRTQKSYYEKIGQFVYEWNSRNWSA